MVQQSENEPTCRDTKTNWEDQAELLRAIAHPVRLMVLKALSEEAQCVKDLNELVHVVQPSLSQHMAALRRIKLVDCHSNGNLRCYYLLRPTLVKKLILLLQQDHPLRFQESRYVIHQAQRHRKATQEKINDIQEIV